MNFRRIISIIIFIITITISKGYGQVYKFGKVSKEELQKTVYEKDSSANAVVLYDERKVYYEYIQGNGFRLVTDIYKRIKLYNKDGFEYGNDEVFLYKNRKNEEKITGLKGITYLLENGKIKETKLKKDGIFKSNFSETLNQVKFTMPSLKEGAVIEYKYKILSPFIANIDKIYLQENIPIKQQKIEVSSPEYFVFKRHLTGFLPVDLKETTSSGKIRLSINTRSGATNTKTALSSREIDYITNKYVVTGSDIPSFKEEPYSGNVDNFVSSLNFELSYVNFPDAPIDYRSTTWGDVSKQIYLSPNFGGELKKQRYYKEAVDKILQQEQDPLRRMFLIYEFVKRKMNWNGKYRVFVEDGVKKAYKEGIGNSSEINLMLTSMLSYAGLKATPVLVSSSDQAISLYPTINGFNYVIAAVRVKNNAIVYLDGTDKYGQPNILPNRILYGVGRIITETGNSQMVNLRPRKVSSNRYNVQCEIKEDGNIEGKSSLTYLRYLAHNYRTNNGGKNEESNIERIKSEYDILEVNEYSRKGVRKYGKGVNERFSFELENQTEAIGDEIFFSPLLFFKRNENPFKSEERVYPVDFGYGFSRSYMINIKIPEGYNVTSLPKTKALKLPNDMGMFSYRTNVMNGTVQLIVNETIKAPVLTSDYYASLKEFYKQIVEKENEQVILKKI